MGRIRQQKTISQLKKILDKHFSIYIRTFYSKNNLVKCFTCDKSVPIKEADTGHYISRTCGALRYSELNVMPQCRHCNRYREGNKDEFALRIIQKFGIERLKELNRWKYLPPVPFKYLELLDLIEDYKNKLKNI